MFWYCRTRQESTFLKLEEIHVVDSLSVFLVMVGDTPEYKELSELVTGSWYRLATLSHHHFEITRG